MGEHFTIRYSSAGFVLLLFTAAGAWFLNRGWVEQGIHLTSEGRLLGVGFGALIAAPIIGVVVHGTVLTGFNMIGRRPFDDRARCLVNERYLHWSLSTGARSLDGFVHPDSIFVRYYYQNAPTILIDWARRRRSYHLLGVSCAVAAPVGFVLGMTSMVYKRIAAWPAPAWDVAALDLLITWVVCATTLARQMKRDADDMELVWSHDFLAQPSPFDPGRPRS